MGQKELVSDGMSGMLVVNMAFGENKGRNNNNINITIIAHIFCNTAMPFILLSVETVMISDSLRVYFCKDFRHQ